MLFETSRYEFGPTFWKNELPQMLECPSPRNDSGHVMSDFIFSWSYSIVWLMPLYGTRSFAMTIPGSPTGGPVGENRLIYHDEFVAAQIGQVGTQFDGLGHVGIQRGADNDKSEMRYYNGVTEQDMRLEVAVFRHLLPRDLFFEQRTKNDCGGAGIFETAHAVEVVRQR